MGGTGNYDVNVDMDKTIDLKLYQERIFLEKEPAVFISVPSLTSSLYAKFVKKNCMPNTNFLYVFKSRYNRLHQDQLQ